jgi:hypothetical protein
MKTAAKKALGWFFVLSGAIAGTRSTRSVLRVGGLTLAGLVAMLLQGCYPAWETFDRSAAYHGRLLDAETSLPVEKATVKIQMLSLKASTKSGADGSFRIGPLRDFRVGIMTLEGLRPDSSAGWPESLEISISRLSYQPLQLNVPSDTSTWNSPVKTSGTWNGDLELGNIRLQPEHKN